MRYTTEERNRRKEQLLQRMEAKRRIDAAYAGNRHLDFGTAG